MKTFIELVMFFAAIIFSYVVAVCVVVIVRDFLKFIFGVGG